MVWGLRFCPLLPAPGQACLGLGIKRQVGRGWVPSDGCRVQPATGKELGIATDCPGSSKKKTHLLKICSMPSTYLYIQCWGLFNPYNSPERLLVLDTRCQQDWAKVTQLGGGRTRIRTLGGMKAASTREDDLNLRLQ